jgi:hypothetical protein
MSHLLPPFIVEVPYSTAPRMVRYQGPLLNMPPKSDYLDAKKIEMAELGSDLFAQVSNPELPQLLTLAAKSLNLSHPESINTIQDLALCLEEDIAILQDDILSAICFCFPSSWVPAKRIGMALGQIHGPVGDGQKLVAASHKIAHVMSDPEQGSFRRYVWTLTNSPLLSQHPAHKNPIPPKSIEDLYYRVETQTTLPLKSGPLRASLFMVKVEVCPLGIFWSNLDQRQLIYESISSMSPAVLEYKNLHEIKNIVIQNYSQST